MHPILHPADRKSLQQVQPLSQIALSVLIKEGLKQKNTKATLEALMSTQISIFDDIEKILSQMYIYWLNANPNAPIRVKQSVLEVCHTIGISSQEVPETSHQSIVDISRFITSYGPIQNLHLRSGTIANLVHKNEMPTPKYQIHGFSDTPLTVLDLWNIPNKEIVEHLFFTDNSLNHICICTDPLQELKSLKRFSIKGELVQRTQSNSIPCIFPNTFCQLNNLTFLALSKIGIKTIEPDAFNGLKKLVKLDLGFNKITTIEPGAFNGLDSLQSLLLCHNQIEYLPQHLFIGLGNLQKLSLLCNHLRFIAQGAFSPLNKVDSISLDLNPELKLPFPYNLAVAKAQHPEWFTAP